eukprot:TRINITY_DN39333_c0_g1_i2.p1 TRINITY_DN39333_c0_g1~~TRINITY_DN39333_c0_g1_i2.p1  ORF type:complete len:440 (+),score=78.80 TRINITY_DN39333_c0_g1_i2:115-1434(+)
MACLGHRPPVPEGPDALAEGSKPRARRWEHCSRLPEPLRTLGDKELLKVHTAVSALVRVGLREVHDLVELQAALWESLRGCSSELGDSCSTAASFFCNGDAVSTATSLAREGSLGCEDEARPSESGLTLCPVAVLPDLAQVHNTLTSLADQLSLPLHCPVPPCTEESLEARKWMVYLMPVWRWQERLPRSQQFWKLAHAVSRDKDGDDWIAPHITLHSRASGLRGLAAKYARMLHDISGLEWGRLLATLRGSDNWMMDEDTVCKERPSNFRHFVLHRAGIELPRFFRSWLFENQDEEFLRPRKQDVKADSKRYVGCSRPPGQPIPIEEPFHISLYGFRAAHAPEDDPASPKLPPPSAFQSGDKSPEAASCERASSFGVVSTWSYSHYVPGEGDLRADLACADWMLILASPGETGVHQVTPLVVSAARLSALAAQSACPE